MKPITQIGEVTYRDQIRRNHQRLVDQARTADISAENRNLSDAWLFRDLRPVK